MSPKNFENVLGKISTKSFKKGEIIKLWKKNMMKFLKSSI
jgi:hypothetical protein